jgi:hypothetical protein
MGNEYAAPPEPPTRLARLGRHLGKWPTFAALVLLCAYALSLPWVAEGLEERFGRLVGGVSVLAIIPLIAVVTLLVISWEEATKYNWKHDENDVEPGDGECHRADVHA